MQEYKNLISQCVTSVSPHTQGWVILLQEKIKLAWFLLEKKISVTFLFPTFALMFTRSQFSGNESSFSGLLFPQLYTLFKGIKQVYTRFKIVIAI